MYRVGIIANGANEPDRLHLRSLAPKCDERYVLATTWKDRPDIVDICTQAPKGHTYIVDVHHDRVRDERPTQWDRVTIVDLRKALLYGWKRSGVSNGFGAWTSTLAYIYGYIARYRVPDKVYVWYNPASSEEYERAYNGEWFWKGVLIERGVRLHAGPGSLLFGGRQAYPWSHERTLVDGRPSREGELYNADECCQSR